jgi:hypothetical protein
MPPTRKYKSGAKKRKEKQKKEALHKTQVGSLNKYFNKVENLVADEIEDEQFTNDEDINENQNQNATENVNEDEDGNEIEEDVGENSGDRNNFDFDVDDPGYWNRIEHNKIDFLVERGPKRVKDVIFPKDAFERSFSSRLITLGICQMGKSKIESG